MQNIGPVIGHVITGEMVANLVAQGVLDLRLDLAESYPRKKPVNKHFGKVLEQEILAQGVDFWKWNVKEADAEYRRLTVYKARRAERPKT